MMLEFVHYVVNSTQDVILAQKRINVYHVKVKNMQSLVTYALFAMLTWKVVILVKTQLFALLASKTIFIWIINAENANFSKAATNAMTKDAYHVSKTISWKIMDVWLARINLTHAWNAPLMMDAPTVLMVTL